MYFLKVYRITDTFELIVKNLSDLTRTHRTATFADSETQTNVQSYSVDQIYSDLYVITRHHHLNTFGKSDFTGAVHSAEIELGTILVTERSMTTALSRRKPGFDSRIGHENLSEYQEGFFVSQKGLYYDKKYLADNCCHFVMILNLNCSVPFLPHSCFSSVPTAYLRIPSLPGQWKHT